MAGLFTAYAVCLLVLVVDIRRWNRVTTARQEMGQEVMLDSIYDSLVGDGEDSILSTLRRINQLTDSLCIELSGEPCLPREESHGIQRTIQAER